MESGHSYLEVDSMHATIERARKHINIYSPREYQVVMEMARKKRSPYKVENVSFKDIKDLKSLGKKVLSNTKEDTDGNKISWLGIKWLRFQKELPHSVQFKYNLSDETFLEFSILGRRAKKFLWSTITLNCAYSKRIPISAQKKQDLLKLLDKGVIPETYAAWFKALPCKKGRRDHVPYNTEESESEPE